MHVWGSLWRVGQLLKSTRVTRALFSSLQAHMHDDGADIVAHECGGAVTKSVGGRLVY